MSYFLYRSSFHNIFIKYPRSVKDEFLILVSARQVENSVVNDSSRKEKEP